MVRKITFLRLTIQLLLPVERQAKSWHPSNMWWWQSNLGSLNHKPVHYGKENHSFLTSDHPTFVFCWKSDKIMTSICNQTWDLSVSNQYAMVKKITIFYVWPSGFCSLLKARQNHDIHLLCGDGNRTWDLSISNQYVMVKKITVF